MDGHEMTPPFCFLPRGSDDCNHVWLPHRGVVENPAVVTGSAWPGVEFSDVALNRICQTGTRLQ
jgi:hypothetical protein